MKDYFNSISCTIIIVWLSRVEKTYISQGQKFHYDLDKRYDETVGVERWDCTLLVNGQFRSKYCWVADAGKISSVSIYAYYDLEKECERLRGMGYFGDIQELKINNIFVDYREHYPCISIYFDKEAQPSFHCSDFTIKVIDDLYAKMQSALCPKGYDVEKTRGVPCSIIVLRRKEIVYRYEFMVDTNGDWICLRCSGNKAEKEIESVEKSRICFGRSVHRIDYNEILGFYDVYIGGDTGLLALDETDKLCIIHAMMHLICFDMSFNSVEPDDESVAIVYRFLGYSSGFHNTLAGKYLWNKAYELDPMHCFFTIALFPKEIKNQIIQMINAIVHEYRTEQRTLALPKLYQYCGLN